MVETQLLVGALTENPEFDLVGVHAADAVVGGADVGAGVLLEHVRQPQDRPLRHRRLRQAHRRRRAAH